MFTINVSAVMLSDATFPSPRAQKRHFCALFAFGTPNFGHFEHKIEVFVRFWPSEPSFSGVSSTKSRFLCQNGRFFRDFGRFEHKIGLFVHGGAVMLVVFADLSLNYGA